MNTMLELDIQDAIAEWILERLRAKGLDPIVSKRRGAVEILIDKQPLNMAKNHIIHPALITVNSFGVFHGIKAIDLTDGSDIGKLIADWKHKLVKNSENCKRFGSYDQ